LKNSQRIKNKTFLFILVKMMKNLLPFFSRQQENLDITKISFLRGLRTLIPSQLFFILMEVKKHILMRDLEHSTR